MAFTSRALLKKHLITVQIITELNNIITNGNQITNTRPETPKSFSCLQWSTSHMPLCVSICIGLLFSKAFVSN